MENWVFGFLVEFWFRRKHWGKVSFATELDRLGKWLHSNDFDGETSLELVRVDLA